jgi:hypothetical protein
MLFARCLLAALCLPVAGLAGSADAEVLEITPGMILRVEFSIPSGLAETPDLFWLSFMPSLEHPIPVVVLEPFGAMVAHLHNEGALLGTDSQGYFGDGVGDFVFNPANLWKTSASVFNPVAIPPTVVDFGTMFSGTNTGRIDFEILTGRMQVRRESIALSMRIGVAQSISQIVEPDPVIQSITLIPEPSSIVLGILATASLAALAIRRRKNR